MKPDIAMLALLTCGLVCACSSGNGPTPQEQCDLEQNRAVTGLDKCSVKIDGHYYVGIMMPFTGSLSVFGPSLENAILLAVNEVNEAGGIDGKCLGVVRCDSATDPLTATEAMAELGQVSPLGAVIGPAASESTVAAAAEAKAAKKVMMSPTSTSPEVTGVDDDGYVFRSCVSDAYQGMIAASLAEREGFGKVFVIARADSYGDGLREVFIETFTGRGGQADSITYDEQDPGYEATVVQTARAYAPDAVFLISFIDDGAAILTTAASDAWTDVEWIFTDGVKDAELLEKVGDPGYLEGIIGTSPASELGGDFAVFEWNYEQMWAEGPNLFGSNCYDAVYLVAIAMALADDPDDGTQIRNALAKTSAGVDVHPAQWDKVLGSLGDGQFNYEGASGVVDLDENGDVLANFEEWTIEDGQIKLVACWTPESEPCP